MRTDLDAQAMKQALEPCPFCGKSDTAKLVAASEMYAPDYEDAIYPHSESYAVVCDASAPKGPGGCGGMGGFKLRKEDAIEAWNRRAALQSRLAAPVGDATPAYELRKAACDLVTKMQAEGFPMMCMDGTPNAVGIILEAWATNPAPDAVRRETVEACAQIAETMERNIPLLGKTENYPGEYSGEYDQGAGDALSECAAAIRAMLKGE